jgi:hypothetical protein
LTGQVEFFANSGGLYNIDFCKHLEWVWGTFRQFAGSLKRPARMVGVVAPSIAAWHALKIKQVQ